MKKLFIIANWKSNKTKVEAMKWLQELTIKNEELGITSKEVIVCPPFTLLSDLHSSLIIHHSSLKLGAQDISPFEQGAYTGEVNGKQIKEFADYVLIGHSERRSNLFENDGLLEKKVTMAKTSGLTSIFFIQDRKTLIPESADIVVYEPPSSISPGPADTPENADRIASHIKRITNVSYVLYGGNVTPQNVGSFTHMRHIDGVVVGRASLDAKEFAEIINNA